MLLSIPSPPVNGWQLGPFFLHIYALCLIAGMIAAWMIGSRRWRARGGEADQFVVVEDGRDDGHVIEVRAGQVGIVDSVDVTGADARRAKVVADDADGLVQRAEEDGQARRLAEQLGALVEQPTEQSFIS